MKDKKVSVIIVNWNTEKLLGDCLSSLLKHVPAGVDYEVIVVDNGSSDASVQMIRSKFREIRLIRNEDNLGFAVANNKGIKESTGEYILFLNTDVVVGEDTIEKLTKFMETCADAGLCSPSLKDRNGSPQETGVSFPSLITEIFGRLRVSAHDIPHKVEAVRGACMFARREAIKKIGGFSEAYFLFLEETDLCLRLKKAGYSIWHVPDASVCHLGGGSAVKKADARIEYWRARYKYFREHYPYWYYYIVSETLVAKLLLDWMANLLGTVCALGVNKRLFSKFKNYSMVLLWHCLRRPGDWGIDSGNIAVLGALRVRSDFIDWWNKNNNQILNESGKLRLLKENDSRKLCIFSDEAYIKFYKKSMIFNKPWVKEWRILNKMRQLDIPTIVPIAVGYKCLVTKKLNGVVSVHDFILSEYNKMDLSARISFAKSFAGFISKIHRKGVCHDDLHAGNILLAAKDGRHEFYLTDLHRAKMRLFPYVNYRINNLVHLDKFFSVTVRPVDRLRFFKYYNLGNSLGVDYKKYARVIAEKTQAACFDLWQKRDRLYLKKNKYGKKGKLNGASYILNSFYADVSPEFLIDNFLNEKGEIIKNSRSSFVSRISLPNGERAVLKIYRQKKFVNYLKDCFRDSKGFRAWRGHWAFITRRINAPVPICAGELGICGVVKKSFIVTKEVDDCVNLTIYSRNNRIGDGDDFVKDLSRAIRTMHDRGLFPCDMKGSNILVSKSENVYVFSFIDLEHLKIKRRPKLSDRLYNYLQIKKSTGISCVGALPIKRILIVKPSSFGDIVQSIPIAGILKRAFPGAVIYWLANREYVEFIQCYPAIDKVIAFERKKWARPACVLQTISELLVFFKKIRDRKFDIVFDLQGLFRSGLITCLSGASVRVGFANARECAPMFYTDKVCPETINSKERYLAQVRYIVGNVEMPVGVGLRVPDESVRFVDNLLLGSKKKIIAINPGGRWETKRWPMEKYATLIDRLQKDHDVKIVLLGDKNDAMIAEQLMDLSKGEAINFAGKTTLRELTALLAKCSFLITNDSGPMHLADHLGIPLVAIFGPTDPRKTGPVGEKSVIVRGRETCSPCFKRRCGNLKCMESVSVDDVIKAIKTIECVSK